jgi:hypothetical protein
MVDPKIRKEYFQQGRLILMWDKRKDKPTMHKEFDCLWYGPYNIEKKTKVGSFYLSMPKGRRLPLPISGSILKPYYVEGTLLPRFIVE